MRTEITYGLERLEIEAPPDSLVTIHRQPEAPALSDPATAVADALETPLGFPALRRALTPDDHVAIVVDEQVPQLPRLLPPILDHLIRAEVRPEAVTLLCPASSAQTWVDELPDSFEEVCVEVHDPSDRKRLAYLATTKRGRRLYINRTAVFADQLVVLTRRGYDPVLGYSGAEGALYPALGDEDALRECWERRSVAAPGASAWPLREEAAEVAWLLGVPFFVQVIEGAGEDVVHILGGPLESRTEGERLLDARWRVEVDEPVDTVIVGVGGDATQHSFADLARALACAARVVKRGGRIALLSGGTPVLGEAAALFRQTEEPDKALTLLDRQRPADALAGFLWASAACQAKIYLLSGLPEDVAEELFAVPLDHAGQVQRLVREGSWLFLADAQKTLAVVR
jgi:nickel-dependent lactate racemase